MTSGTYSFTRDLLGRPTSIDGPWADDTIGYAYNDAARSVTRTSPGGLTQTTVGDSYDRTGVIVNILGTFTNTYDGVGGPLTQITHAGANAGFNTAFTYHGDALSRALSTITSSKPGGTTIAKHTYGYNPLGQIKSWKREATLANPSGNTSQYESAIYYDQADQLSSLVNQPLAGSSVANTGFHYLYDPAGNVGSKQVEKSASSATMTSIANNSRNQPFIVGFEGPRGVVIRGETNEPATVKVKPSIVSVWKDARMLEGNRFESDQVLTTGMNQLDIRAKDGAGNTSNYTYSLNIVDGGLSLPEYDKAGNLLFDGTRTFEWDWLSRLIKISWGANSNKTTEYRYNALSQRSEQIEKTGTTETAHYYYLYEGSKLLCRYNGGTTAANIDRQYLSQGEQRKSGSLWSSYYYNRDHLGSIREVMNSNGTLAARYDYEPYGKRIVQYEASGYTCDLGFTGHITQQSAVTGQSEIVLTLFRAYDPDSGKWLSADPIGETGGMNLYAYVGGDPMNAIDPFGLDLILLSGKVSGTEGRDRIASLFRIAANNSGIDGNNEFEVHGHGTCDNKAFDDRDAIPIEKLNGDRRIKGAANRKVLDAEALADLIQKEGSWKPGMPVILFICNAGVATPGGTDNLAMALAKALAKRGKARQEVRAPTGSCSLQKNPPYSSEVSQLPPNEKRSPAFYPYVANP